MRCSIQMPMLMIELSRQKDGLKSHWPEVARESCSNHCFGFLTFVENLAQIAGRQRCWLGFWLEVGGCQREGDGHRLGFPPVEVLPELRYVAVHYHLYVLEDFLAVAIVTQHLHHAVRHTGRSVGSTVRSIGGRVRVVGRCKVARKKLGW